jgi:Calcineurin-like phosphoesterase
MKLKKALNSQITLILSVLFVIVTWGYVVYAVFEIYKLSSSNETLNSESSNNDDYSSEKEAVPTAAPLNNLPLAAIQKPDFEETIILAGDAGNLSATTNRLLKYHLSILPSKTTVYFLGDNIYPHGLVRDDHPRFNEAKERLMRQVSLIKESKSRAVFVPGNHDWDNSNKLGWELIRRENSFITGLLGPDSFAPKGGCPGPDIRQHTNNVQVVILDTQWWLHNHEKPQQESDGCSEWSEELVYDKLKQVISGNNANKITFVLNHHPLESTGPHGRKDNCSQDVGCPKYYSMRKKLLETLDVNKPLICAAGHDHSLQFMTGKKGCQYFLVSGGMSDTSSVRQHPNNLFALESLGFARLDLFKDGSMRLRFIIPDDSQVTGRVAFEYLLNLSRIN